MSEELSPYRIVVGVDFGEASRIAIAHALKILARMPLGEIHLTAVVPSDRGARFGDQLAKDEAAMEDAQKRLKVELHEAGKTLSERAFDARCVFHVRLASSVVQALEQVALDVDADIVLVGTRGRRGLERMLLGSVAEELIRSGRVPVLIARPTLFEGMSKTAQIEPARPGVDIHSERHDILSSTDLVSVGRRSSHVSGLL